MPGEEAGHSLAAELEQETSTLLGEVVERFIHWPSMTRSLKLVTGLAVAQIVVAAVLVVLGGIQGIGGHFPSVSLFVVDNQLVSTSLPVLVATLVFLAASWGYLLAGVMHSHPSVQLVGLALFTWLTFSGWDDLTIGVGTLWITIVLVVVMWLVSGATWLLHRRARRRLPTVDGSGLATAVAFFILAVLVGGIYLNAYLTVRAEGAPLLFYSGLSVELTALSVLLIPLLLMAGADFADLADLAGRRLGAFTWHRVGSRALFGTTAAVALAVVAYQLVQFRNSLGVIGVDVGLGVLAFGIVALLLWAGRVTSRAALAHIPQGAVALVAVISYGLTYTLIFIPAQNAADVAAKTLPAVSYGPYSYTGSPAFHLEKPTAWEAHDATTPGQLPVVQLNGLGSGDPAVLTVSASPSTRTAEQSVSGALLQLAAPSGLLAGQTAYLDNGHQQGSLHVDDIHSVPIFGGVVYHGRAWTEVEGGDTWLIIGITPEKDWAFNEPLFDRMASTFGLGPPRAEPTTPAANTGTDTSFLGTVERPETITLGTLLLLGIAALTLTRLRLGRRFTARLTTAAVFMTLVAVLAIAALPNYVIDVVTNVPGHDLTPFHIEGVQTLVGLLSLTWLAWVALRRGIDRLVRPLQLVLSLNIGLQILSWLFDLYTQSKGVSNFTVAQAVILLLAFLVDILLSGEGITNRDGRLFPRRARVHLYFGYVLLTAAVILYFTSLRFQANGAPVSSQFESDQYPQTGLIQLGIPVLFTLFLLGLSRWRAAGTSSTAAEAHP